MNSEKMKNALLAFQTQSLKHKIPVMLLFHQQRMWKSLKPFLMVAISRNYTLQQFKKVVELKLIWNGYLSSSETSLYFYINRKQLNISHDTMGQIYNKFKSSNNWLEISLFTTNPF